MSLNDGDCRVVELFRAAALDGDLWLTALDAFATATGARSGNLVGVKPGLMAFEWASNLDPQIREELDDRARGDPEINPRVKNGLKAAPFEVLGGIDYASDAWTRAYPEYGEACRRYDVGGGSQAVLHRSAAGFIGLATLRSAAQGAPTSEQTETFRRLAPHVLDAVRLRRMVEEEGARFALGALDAVSATAFLCDELGRVRALTRGGEALVGAGGALSLKDGRLTAPRTGDSEAIAAAIRRAADTPDQALTSLVVRDGHGALLLLEVATLPNAPWSMAFAPRVIVTARPRPRPPSTEQLQSTFGLTLAEAEIALCIAKGMPRERIALARGVSPGTVKSQLQSVFAKLGVARESEIPILLSGL